MKVVRTTQFKVEPGPISDGACRLSITGELDLATTPLLEAEVNRALQGGASVIELDLANLSFIDSTGLRMFLHLNGRAAADGWRLFLLRPSEPVKTIIRVTGAGGELPVMEDSSP